jgi:hypothetical protein
MLKLLATDLTPQLGAIISRSELLRFIGGPYRGWAFIGTQNKTRVKNDQ